MNKIQHRSNNGVLGAPGGWNQGELPVGALPITRSEVGGVEVVISYWKPTTEELAQLNAGHAVALYVVGKTMPPVQLAVEE